VSRAQRGDIWLVDLGMVAKTRPVLILSVAPIEQDRSLVTFIPRTTQVRGTASKSRTPRAGSMPAPLTRRASPRCPPCS
jgi:mRNA-degrading endonuclease toxin of MazEF toxin-antitoxin module